MPYPINQRAHQFNSIQSVPVSFGLWDTALKFLSPGHEGLHWTANEYAEERRIFLFSLRDINLTLGLLPPRKHVVWRDSVGVEGSGSGLKIIVRGYFASEFSLLRHTDEPQKGRNSCLWLQTRYVLSSFGVLLMSCRVKFHVVRSALQYSACRIIMSFPRPPQ